MRKLIIGLILLASMSACGRFQKKKVVEEPVVEVYDSLKAYADSIQMEEEYGDEEKVSVHVDGSFPDFMYGFSTSEKLQKKRIVFPLSYYQKDKKVEISKADWKFDPMFSALDSYTVLFDSEDDMDVKSDTSMHSVRVEWYYLQENRLKSYYFERKDGRWMLEAIDDAERPQPEENGKEDFIDFYEHFVNDSVFQRSRLHTPLKFVTVDPEDEFQILETVLEDGQWFAFKPNLPEKVLTNINYGQHSRGHINKKVMEVKGFSNGFVTLLYFERRQGKWKLVQFDDAIN